jgi:hypothetical protein
MGSTQPGRRRASAIRSDTGTTPGGVLCQLLVLAQALAPAANDVVATGVGTAGSGSGPCGQSRCPADWGRSVEFVGVGPRNQSDLCGMVDTCASEVAQCDYTQPPDEVFATCKALPHQPKLRRFRGGLTGANTSAFVLEQTVGEPGPFVLFIAPQLGSDFSGWACSYVFSYLATQVRKTASFFEFSLCLSRACLGKMIVFIYKWLKKCRFSQGIATFVATIPDPGTDGNACSFLRRFPTKCDRLLRQAEVKGRGK